MLLRVQYPPPPVFNASEAEDCHSQGSVQLDIAQACVAVKANDHSKQLDYMGLRSLYVSFMKDSSDHLMYIAAAAQGCHS